MSRIKPTPQILNLAMIVVLATIFTSAGCAKLQSQKQTKYQTIRASNSHDTDTAKAKSDEALELLSKCQDFPLVEQRLNEALVADSTYGPAHNSLGTLYLRQDKYYLAAWEFEYAIKLMPGQAQPYNNLGLVYERVGKYEDAIQYYSIALSCDSNNPELIGNLVRARMLNGDRSPDLKIMLSDLALNHNNPVWQQWARDQVALGNFDEATVIHPVQWSNGGVTLTDELPEPTLESSVDFESMNQLDDSITTPESYFIPSPDAESIERERLPDNEIKSLRESPGILLPLDRLTPKGNR